MNISRRIKTVTAGILMVLLMLTFIFAGCSGKSSENDGGGSGEIINNGDEQIDAIMNREGLPIAKEPGSVTLKVFVATNPNAIDVVDMRWTKEVEEATGIKIEWQQVSETESAEKLRLMLAGGDDLPDIIMNGINNFEVVEYMDQGFFRPVDDLIENWMPNLRAVYEKRPDYRKAGIAPDGNTYGFPYIEEMYGLGMSPGPIYIYKPWLDKLNMEMPTTLDEYRAFLEKVRDTDLNENGINDEIPLTFQVGGWDSYEGYHQIISCFGINDMYNHLTVVDGQVVNTTTLPEFKDGIAYVNSMYKDGLIDEDAFMPAMSGDPRARILGLLNSQTVTLASVQLFDKMGEITISPERRSEYVALPRLTGPTGEKQGIHYNQTEITSATRCIITANCKYPELAARWIDYCYEPEQSVHLNWGTEGYIYNKDEDGVLRWDVDEDGEPILKEGYDSFNQMRWANTPVFGGLAILNDYYETVVEFPLDAEMILEGQRAAGLDEYLAEREYLPMLWFTPEEIETLTQMELYVNNLVNASVTKWLMEGGVEEDWEAYQQSLEDAQIDKVLGVYQAAYDRYKANAGL